VIRSGLVCCCVLLVFTILRPAAGQPGETQPPSLGDQIYKQLIKDPVRLYASNIGLVKDHPEEAYAIVRDHWSDLTLSYSKQIVLVTMKAGNNPHMLDVLDLATRDDNSNIRYLGYEGLISYAFHIFRDADPKSEYEQWHKSNAGLTQEQVILRDETSFFRKLDNTQDAVDRNNLLLTLMRVDFVSDLRVAEYRRTVAKQLHVLDILARELSGTSPPTVGEVFAVRLFQPDLEFLRRTIAPLTTSHYPDQIRYRAAALLAEYKSPLAMQVLQSMAMERPSMERLRMLQQPFAVASDPALVPVLIALLESNDDPTVDLMFQYPLQKLTLQYGPEVHDGGWWRLWWNQYSARLTSVTDKHIPVIRNTSETISKETASRRRLVWHDLGSEGGYWLACPAYIPEPAGSTIPAHTFGLLVAIVDPGILDKTAQYWLEAVHRALKDGYYVAIVSPPAVDSKVISNPSGGLGVAATHSNIANSDGLVQNIVDDVIKRAPIDRNRCFVHGVERGGVIAYRCMTSKTATFRGCYILASPFRSADIGSLTYAKGRNFYIQCILGDKNAPMWQSNAGGELLKRQGARVDVVEVAGEPGYKFTGDPWKPITDAITWLEQSK